MKLSAIEIINLGRKYIKLWPVAPELAQFFAEYHAIRISRLVCNIMPGFALFCFIMQLYWGSLTVLPQALLYTLCLLSFPMHSLIIMGLNANKFLTPALTSWYKESVARVNEGGGSIKLSTKKPRYIDLAYLLHITYQYKH